MADRLLCTLGEAFGEDYNESIERVTPEEVELLQLRTGQVVSEICSKHRKLYLQHYSLGQKKCCDPLENHPTKIMVRSLRHCAKNLVYATVYFCAYFAFTTNIPRSVHISNIPWYIS